MSTQKKHSYFYRNGLTIVFLSMFIFTLGAQALTGWKQHNQELQEDNAAEIGLPAYLQSGHFISATFENFQSEFLSVFSIVFLTVYLRQKGSPESKPVDAPDMETGK